jgi:hypothetical protein
VNYWAWLEANTDWRPHWYISDHNDAIFNIPTWYYATLLNSKLIKNEYSYPEIINFFSSNTAYLYHNGIHILNTRFVNYCYDKNGHYSIKHAEGTIVTKNIISMLDPTLLPLDFHEMDESTIGLASHKMYSMGLEDIRLYSYKDSVKFIATNVNYVGNRANRMIVGEYDIVRHCYLRSRIIQPPTNTQCEKNWVPIVRNEEELFIYKWSPFQLGKIGLETDQLEIIESYEIKSPDFHRIRGSSIFTESGDVLIGVVHFCEETIPRQYYHMLVTLDKTTLKPVSYSDPFCFQHYGVEFCIGFTVLEEAGCYVFWVSKKDNDTVMVSLEKGEIPICHAVLY